MRVWRSDRSGWLLSRPLLVYLVTRAAWLALLFAVTGYAGDGHSQLWERSFGTPILHGAAQDRAFPDGYGYGPLYPYLIAGGLGALGAPLGIAVAFLTGDLLCVIFGPVLAREIGGPRAERATRAFLLVAPVLWFHASVGAQDEPLLCGFLLAAAVLGARGRWAGSGVVLGLGLAFTKVLLGVYLLPFAVVAWRDSRRSALTGIFAALGTAVLCYALWFPFPDSLAALRGDGGIGRHLETYSSMGISLPDYAASLVRISGSLRIALLAAGATAASAIGAWVAWRSAGRDRARGLCAGVAALNCVLLLCIPGSLNHYIVQGFVFVLLVVAVWNGRVARGMVACAVVAGLTALLWNASPFVSGSHEVTAVTLWVCRAQRLSASALLAWALVEAVRWRSGACGNSSSGRPRLSEEG